MRFSVVVRRLPPPFYTTVKTKSNLTEFGLEKFRNTELEFETIGIISKFIMTESRDLRTARSELVRDFQNFAGPVTGLRSEGSIFAGPVSVRDFKLRGGPGPVRDFWNSLGRCSSWSQISLSFPVLVWSGPRFLCFYQDRTRTEPLGLGLTGFGPWIPDHEFEHQL